MAGSDEKNGEHRTRRNNIPVRRRLSNPSHINSLTRTVGAYSTQGFESNKTILLEILIALIDDIAVS